MGKTPHNLLFLSTAVLTTAIAGAVACSGGNNSGGGGGGISNEQSFRQQVESYASATTDMVINVSNGFLLTGTVTIPANAQGRTLTITSSDPQKPAILQRGFGGAGHMIDVTWGAKLLLKDVRIDGNKGNYPSSHGSLVFVSREFTLTTRGSMVSRRQTTHVSRLTGISRFQQKRPQRRAWTSASIRCRGRA